MGSRILSSAQSSRFAVFVQLQYSIFQNVAGFFDRNLGLRDLSNSLDCEALVMRFPKSLDFLRSVLIQPRGPALQGLAEVRPRFHGNYFSEGFQLAVERGRAVGGYLVARLPALPSRLQKRR